MSETINRDWCPKCNAVNYVNLGDLQDVTVCDIDGVQCWKCGFRWLYEGTPLPEEYQQAKNPRAEVEGYVCGCDIVKGEKKIR